MSSVEGVRELLGFEVQQRTNDALLIRNMRLMEQVRAVRPATDEELQMFRVILGLTMRLEEATLISSADIGGTIALRAKVEQAEGIIEDLQQELKKANVRADDAEAALASLDSAYNAKQRLNEHLYEALNEARANKVKAAKGKKGKR